MGPKVTIACVLAGHLFITTTAGWLPKGVQRYCYRQVGCLRVSNGTAVSLYVPRRDNNEYSPPGVIPLQLYSVYYPVLIDQ